MLFGCFDEDQSSEPVHEPTTAENISMDRTDASTDGTNATQFPKDSAGPGNLTYFSEAEVSTNPANPPGLTNTAATDSKNPTDAVLNSPEILDKCPEDLRALTGEILITDNAAAAWSLSGLSPVEDTVHSAEGPYDRMVFFTRYLMGTFPSMLQNNN
ncbi:hypothetical protein BGZ65_009987, partial [Modicella reniformis]